MVEQKQLSVFANWATDWQSGELTLSDVGMGGGECSKWCKDPVVTLLVAGDIFNKSANSISCHNWNMLHGKVIKQIQW